MNFQYATSAAPRLTGYPVDRELLERGRQIRQARRARRTRHRCESKAQRREAASRPLSTNG
jgi:hypothetical protein